MEVNSFSFEYPVMLWFLLFVPVFVVAFFYSTRRKRKDALLFSNFKSLEHVAGRTFTPSYFFQVFLNMAVFLLLVFAAAGLTLWLSGPLPEADFALVVDSSASMSAQDVNSSRLGSAREVALSFVDSLPPTSKVALISFAGTPFVEQSLTDDISQVRSSVKGMELRSEGGTDIASALVVASNILSLSDRPKVILLFSDGVSTVGMSVKDSVDYLVFKHITVHAVGIGTESGGNMMDIEGEKDTRIDEASLVYIAESTMGKYHRFSSQGFKLSYEDVASSGLRKVGVGLTPFLISIVILIIGIQWVLSFTRFSRIP